MRIQKKSDKDKVSAYFVKLHLEVTEKVQKLKRFQDELNSRCTAVNVKIDYANLSGPSVSQGPSSGGAVPRNHRYAPIHNFLPSEGEKPWYMTALDFITDKDFSTILEWLDQGKLTPHILTPLGGLSSSWIRRPPDQ